MKHVGHGKLSLTRTKRMNGFWGPYPRIELEVDIFQTEDNELKFFYAPDGGDSFLVIETAQEAEN